MAPSDANGISIVGEAVKVVEHAGLTIEEVIGNVSTKNDELSVAVVTVADAPTSEPWLTLHYDEWMYVTEGYIELHQEHNGTRTVVKAEKGQTAFIPSGSRFQPVFPVACSYIPVCIPAFSPERCIREEGTELSGVSVKLNELHGAAKKSPPTAEEVHQRFHDVETIYHMCQTSLYKEAKKSNKAYFPPTFVQDGRFTHATAVPANLITTANHFYTSTKGDWICLELSRTVLEEKLGIVTLFECAKPVGDIDTDEEWKGSVFPHIFGGIPVNVEGVVTNVYKMKRSDDGTFLSIDDLVD